MAYDRESFLSGLAVGRVLWRPPIVVPDIGTFMKVSAFPTGEYIDLNWSATRGGISYDFVRFKITTRKYGAEHPTPVYWFLERLSSIEIRALLFTPDEEIVSGEYWASVIGETEEEQEILVSDISFRWDWGSGVDGRYIKHIMGTQVRYGESQNPDDFWQSFIEEGYLGWDSTVVPTPDLAFSESAELVETDALYLVGVIRNGS